MMNDQAVAQNSGNDCPVCGGVGWITSIGDDGREVASQCSSCQKERRSHDKTGVPLRFYEADLSKFSFDIYSKNMDKLKKLSWNFIDRFKEWRDEGKGFYLWSETPGSGKTFLSCCLGKSIMIKYDLQMRFITVPDYIAAVANSYKREQGATDESQIYRECDLLIFDDMGTQKSGEWQSQEIFRIVNDRLNNGKVTIYTSNMPPENLNIDNRTIDRLMKSSIVIQMPEESIRWKQAKAEQEDFLARML